MTKDCYQRDTCRLCTSPALDLLVDFGETPAANAYRKKNDTSPIVKYPLEVMGCTHCGHVQLHHVVNPKVLFTNYKYASGTSAVFREHFAKLAVEIAAWSSVERATRVTTILEVGSNDGTLLRALRRHPMPIVAVGIEPSSELAGSDEQTVSGFFSSETLKKAQVASGQQWPFDFMVANNVLAHVDDLAGVFALAHEAQIKTVVFEVQSEQALLRDSLFDMVYHEHLDYHSVPPLFNALMRWGYLVTRVDKVATHGGSIRVWASRESTRTEVPESDLRSMLIEEVDTEKRFNAWRSFRKIDAAPLQAELLKHPRIACYGAPAKLTTFAHVMLKDVGNVEYVVDDSLHKQGLMTPDGRWEIFSPLALVSGNMQPDAVLVTAWNFAESITKKLREGGFKGPIIVPFPQLVVV